MPKPYWSPEKLLEMRDKHLPESTTLQEALNRLESTRTLSKYAFQNQFKKLLNKNPSEFLRQPGSTAAGSEEDQLIQNLVKTVKSGSRTLEGLCDKLHIYPSEARRLIDLALSRGYSLKVDLGRLQFAGLEPLPPRSITFPNPTRDFTFAVVSDTHFGSRWARDEEFKHFVTEVAYKEYGVRDIFHCGDLMDGEKCYRGHQYELTHVGFDAQAEHALEALPQLPDLNYYILMGNHDLKFHALMGLNPGQALENKARAMDRNDITYLGDNDATIYYGGEEEGVGLRINIRHPDGGVVYADSYKMQQYIAGLQPGLKPQMVFSGHRHIFNKGLWRHVYGIECPCFQAQTDYLARKGKEPRMGGLIINVKTSDDFSIRRFADVLVPYYGEEQPRTFPSRKK